MPARTRKLGINDRDKSALGFSEDDLCRHWVSADVWNPRNADPRVAFNQQDNSFEHLKIAAMPLVGTKIIDAPDFSDLAPEKETKYLGMLRDKLSLAKDYILKEKELSLDPDGIGMRHETMPVILAVPPIMIDIYSQQMTQLLIETAAELRRLHAENPEDESSAALDQSMRDYLEFWVRLQMNLVWQLPGKNEEDKMNKADRIMDEVLEKLVEP
jgi:hypothetical protein